MKKQRKNEIGITLVALIVTIIILLVLAGISITILNHTELLKNVKQAKDTTENAQKEENETLSKYNNKIDEIVSSATRDDNSGKGKILWKNNDITQEFPAQTITINDSLNNYDYIKIFYKTNNVSNVSNPTVDNKTFSTECLVINNGIQHWQQVGICLDGQGILYIIELLMEKKIRLLLKVLIHQVAVPITYYITRLCFHII